MSTLAQTIGQFGVDVLEHHDRDLDVPVCTGLIRQGDVMIVPATMVRGGLSPAIKPVSPAGVPVVRGEAGGNTHLLLADGDVRFEFNEFRDATDLGLGTLTVGKDATAYLAHPEHAYTGIAPGTYEIRRQREQADEIRLVAD